MRVTIQVGVEQHALLGDLAERVQAEDLEPTGIGQNRPGPSHELVQPAKGSNNFMSWTKKEVISVAKNNLSVKIFK